MEVFPLANEHRLAGGTVCGLTAHRSCPGGETTEAPRGLGATHMEVRSSHFALRTSTLDLSTGITK